MVREEGIGYLNTSPAIRQTLYALFRIDYMVTTASLSTRRVIVIAKRDIPVSLGNMMLGLLMILGALKRPSVCFQQMKPGGHGTGPRSRI